MNSIDSSSYYTVTFELPLLESKKLQRELKATYQNIADEEFYKLFPSLVQQDIQNYLYDFPHHTLVLRGKVRHLAGLIDGDVARTERLSDLFILLGDGFSNLGIALGKCKTHKTISDLYYFEHSPEKVPQLIRQHRSEILLEYLNAKGYLRQRLEECQLEMFFFIPNIGGIGPLFSLP